MTYCRIIENKNGSVKFEVDENLSEPLPMDGIAISGKQLAEQLTRHYPKLGKESIEVIRTSFENERSIHFRGRDAFFNMITLAYGEHRPIVLSPDAIWLLICQGFNRYVNANPERHRALFVSHRLKRTLTDTKCGFRGLEKEDWPEMVENFARLIARNTVSDIGSIITAEYSTTSQAERIASQITLMDTVKEYFEYVASRRVCGIPSISLTGTPDDWREVYRKALLLKQYGVSGWIRKMEYILREFIHTAEGQPKQVFWRSMVKKYRPGKITRPRGCGWCYDRMTKVDGWILRFFPEGPDCTLRDKVLFDHTMPIEMVSVPFRFLVEDYSGTNIARYAMELYAGFVGIKEEPGTLELSPQIGWLVCRKNKE